MLPRNTYIYIGAIFLVVALIALAVSIVTFKMPSNSIVTTAPSFVSVPILITGSAYAPNGTTAIIMSYSSAKVYVNGSGWVSGSGAGTVELYMLRNKSAVIGSVSVPKGSVIGRVNFNVTSIQVYINGAPHKVSNPNGEVNFSITDGVPISPNSTIVIESTPVIMPFYLEKSVNLTNGLSFSAFLISDVNASKYTLGSIISNSGQESAAIASNKPDILAPSASVGTSQPSSSSIVFVVKNNSPHPVTIRNLLVYGTFSESFVLLQPTGLPNDTTFMVNNIIKGVGATINRYGVIALKVAQNQDTVLVLQDGNLTNAGYTLAPGASVTMLFNGNLSVGQGHIGLSFNKGAEYTLVITGDGNAAASFPATSS